MSALGPGCVKTRLSQGRAELFSQLPSPSRSCQCNRFSTTTKSRRKFYAQVQRRSFHTAWVKTGKAQCEHMFSALPLKADITLRTRYVRFVPISEVGDIIRSARRHARAAMMELLIRVLGRS